MKHWLIGMGIKNSRRILLWPMLMCAIAAPLQAAPYWVAWEGNDFPENEGWTRGHFGDEGPQADRSLANGIMTLDGLANIEIIDGYLMERPLDPGPGEEFVAQWGLRVDEVIAHPFFPYDPGMIVYSDDGWEVILTVGVAEASSVTEQVSFAVEPGILHNWEFRSTDMRAFTLLLNGSVIHTGLFTPAVTRSHIEWGDIVAGAASLSHWDYFRFGVVPEPTSGISLFTLLLAARASIRTRRV